MKNQNQIQNHHIKGICQMSNTQGLIAKGHKILFVLTLVVIGMTSYVNHAVAADLIAYDAASFQTAVNTANSNLDSDNTIVLTGNVDFTAPFVLDIGSGKKLTIDLSSFNIMGTQDIEVTGIGNAELTITGNTIGMNLGLDIQGQVTVNYDGTYTSASDDVFGKNSDDVTINFDIVNPNPYSTWNATNRTITVGEQGTAKFNVGSGNHVLSQDVIVGEYATGDGTINIYNQGTYWKNTDNFLVGNVGTGALYLGMKDGIKSTTYHGAILETGNFTLGGNGIAHITGTGTILNIFGTSEAPVAAIGSNATMIVDERAEVYLNSTKGDAYMSLATGTTKFDNAYFQLDRGFIDATNNDILFRNNAMFEGTHWDWDSIGTNGTIGAGTLTIDDAVFSPGFGNKVYWDKGGALDFSEAAMVGMYYTGKIAGRDRFGYISTDALTLGAESVSIFDFDVQGDTNHPNAGVNDRVDEHKDYVDMIGGPAQVDGHIHFRPMSGFYKDNIEIDFINSVSGSFDSITIWPQRWFSDVDIAPNTGKLTMTRHTSPFNNSGMFFNEKSVGTALDVIYNEHQALNHDNNLADQQLDEWFPVLDWMWGMGDYDFRMAMRQLAGEARVSSFYMPLRSPWRYGFDRTNWRKRDNHIYFGQQNANCAIAKKSSLWVTPYYDYQHMSEDNNITGANISRVSFMAGYDRAIGNYSAIGFLFGYSQPKMDQGHSRVIADDYLFALHGSTRILDDFELKLWGSYGTQNYRLNRHIPIGNGENLNAKYSGNSWTGSVQLAKPVNFRKGVLRPLVAVDYSYVEQNSATENGYFPVALKYADSDWSQLFARAGVRADFGWSKFNISSTITYSYQFAGDVTPTCTNQFLIGGPEFEIQGNDLSRSFVNVGLGTQIYLNKVRSRMLFAQYNGVYGDNMNSQNASLGYQWTF